MHALNDTTWGNDGRGFANGTCSRAVLLAVLCACVAACDDQGTRYDKDPKGNVITKEDKERIDPEDRSEQAERRVDEEE
jgi:hypothetical protein